MKGAEGSEWKQREGMRRELEGGEMKVKEGEGRKGR